MPYTNVDIFREKGSQNVSKNNLKASEFYEKIGQKQSQ
jgi:hypothetical protein